MFELPLGIKINSLIDDLRILSWEAADCLLYYAQILKDSNFKSNILKNDDIGDPVTFADLKVNEIIIQRINQKYQNIGWQILSEENVKTANHICDTNNDWLWVLDPLDGTKDFIQGTGDYAMHLALNYRNTPFIGIVLIPERDELWIANGEKVWCEKRDGSKKIFNISNKKTLHEMIIVTSKNHRNKNLRDLIEKIYFKKVIVMGSIGCKIASIIRGESDIYICLSMPGKSSPKDWDFAAPAAILKAAGGSITNINGEDLTYNQKDFMQGGIIIASMNKKLHSDICTEVKEIAKKYDLYPLKG